MEPRVSGLISAEELARLQTEVETLRARVATLQRQKNLCVAELTEVLKTYIPIPPTEEEMKAAKPNSEELAKLIADLEAEGQVWRAYRTHRPC